MQQFNACSAFTEVSVPSQENEQSNIMYVRIYLFTIGTVPTLWYFMFLIVLQNEDIKYTDWVKLYLP